MLEVKIAELTDAIDRLIHALSNQQAPAPAQQEKVDAAPQQAPEAVKADGVPSLEDLQALCMQAVRKDRANKQRIQTLIASYGGTLMKDVPEDKRSEMMDAIRGLSLA